MTRHMDYIPNTGKTISVMNSLQQIVREKSEISTSVTTQAIAE